MSHTIRDILSRAHTAALALATMVTLLCVATDAHAGPWVKSPGQGYIKLSGDIFSSDKVYDLDGTLTDPPFDYSQRAARTYVELGLLPRTALQVSLPFIDAQNTVERTEYRRWGFGDLDTAVQFQLLERPCAVAATAGLRVPLYEQGVGESGSPVLGRGTTAAQRYTPVLGDKSNDVWTLLGVGCSLHRWAPAWVAVEAGPQFRFQGFGHGFRFAADAGIFAWPERVAVTVRVDGVQRFTSDNPMPTKNFLNFSGGVLVNIYSGFALEAGATYLPIGAFVTRGWGINVGVSYNGRIFPDPFGAKK